MIRLPARSVCSFSLIAVLSACDRSPPAARAPLARGPDGDHNPSPASEAKAATASPSPDVAAADPLLELPAACASARKSRGAKDGSNAGIAAECAELERVIQNVHDARVGRAPAQKLTVYSTYGWGCVAPPFALRPEVQFDGLMLALVLAPGIPVPERTFWHQGRYRVTGHFTGKTVDLGEWLRSYTGTAPGERACSGRMPEFVVTAWCYADPLPPKTSKRSDVPMDPAKHAVYACERR